MYANDSYCYYYMLMKLRLAMRKRFSTFFLSSLKKLVLLPLTRCSFRKFRCLAKRNMILSSKNWILNFLWHCFLQAGNTWKRAPDNLISEFLDVCGGQGVLFSYYCLHPATINIHYLFNLPERKSHEKNIFEHAIAHWVFRAELYQCYLCCTHN